MIRKRVDCIVLIIEMSDILMDFSTDVGCYKGIPTDDMQVNDKKIIVQFQFSWAQNNKYITLIDCSLYRAVFEKKVFLSSYILVRLIYKYIL